MKTKTLYLISAMVVLTAFATVTAAAPADLSGADVMRAAKAMLNADPTLRHNPLAILVRFDPAAGETERDQARQKIGGARLRTYQLVPGLELVEVRDGMAIEDAVNALQAQPGVIYAEPDHVVYPDTTPSDPYFGLLWGLNNTGQSVNHDRGTADADIDAPEAWWIFTGDPDFVVAVIDTGTDYTHPDLAANIWVNEAEANGTAGLDDDGNGYVDDIHGWDFYDDDADPMDERGHGTHTAGTIAAVGNNGVGVVGVNWQCKIMPLRFIGPNGGYTSDAVDAIEYATIMEVKVSNNSWGGTNYDSSLYDAINAAKRVGHILVASAGNDGVDNKSNPHYPSSYDLDNILAVAATDNDDRLAAWSCYGSESVDLGAPGVNVLSTYPGNQYAYASGTSMAGPHVAGVVALVYAKMIADNLEPSYDDVIARILETTRPLASLAGKTVTGGVVNALKALDPTSLLPVAPGAPVVTKDGTVARLSWVDMSANEVGFEIQRQKKSGKRRQSAIAVGQVGAGVQSFADTPGRGTFQYRVRAFNGAGVSDSGWSASVTF